MTSVKPSRSIRTIDTTIPSRDIDRRSGPTSTRPKSRRPGMFGRINASRGVLPGDPPSRYTTVLEASAMPRTNRPPSYRLHKATGQAVVTLDDRDHYLGRYDSAESRAE